MRQSVKEWRVATPERMEELGAALAASLVPRPGGASVVYLSGNLGTGKTTFAKGFVRGCGIHDAVRSPTYALFEPYEGRGITVLHMDLYRVRDPAELDALGLRDWTGPGHVWLIEWPERGSGKLPPPDVQLALAVAGEHVVTATAASPFGAAWLERASTA